MDVSLYKDAQEAVKAIKKASTSPQYLVQTVKAHEYDDMLRKVAQATGCSPLPEDGKIDIPVAHSYIEDLRFGNRISGETAKALRSKIDSGENVLGVLRSAFMAPKDYTRPVREGGVPGHYRQEPTRKYANRDRLKQASYQALSKGLSLDKIEAQVAQQVPTPEAIGLVRDVLSSMKQVHADALCKCTTERYPLGREAYIQPSQKCESCILKTESICTKQGARFVGASDPDKATIHVDPKTSKVLYAENPDVERSDLHQEYDMQDTFGSGMIITLGNMQGKKALDVDVSCSREGMDLNMSDL